MPRLRADNVGDPTGASNPISITVGGAVTWSTAPTNMPTVASPNTLAVIVNPNSSSEQRVIITAYTAGATSATASTTLEGGATLAAVTSQPWVHGPTSADFFDEQVLFNLGIPYEIFRQTKAHMVAWGTFVPTSQDYLLKLNLRGNNLGGAYAAFTFLAGQNGGAATTPLAIANMQSGAVAAGGVTDFRSVLAGQIMWEQVGNSHYEWRLTGLTPGATYTWQVMAGEAGGAQRVGDVGSNPYGADLSPDNRTLWVANNGDNSVIPITVGMRPNWQNAFGNAPPFSASGRPIPGFTSPYGVAVSPDGTKVAVCNSTARTITIINAATKQIVGTSAALSGTGSVFYCGWTQDSSTLWAGSNGSLFSLNTSLTAAPTVNGTSYLVRTAGDQINTVLCHPDGKTIWVANWTANTAYSAPMTSNTTLGSFTASALPTGKAGSIATAMTWGTVAAGTTLTSALFNLTATNVHGHFTAQGAPILVPISGGYATITYQYALYTGTSVTFYNCSGGAGQTTVAGTVIVDQGVYAGGLADDLYRIASPGATPSLLATLTASVSITTLWVTADNAEIWATGATGNVVEARQVSDGQVTLPAQNLGNPTYTVKGSTDGYVYVTEYPTGNGSVFGWNSGLMTINPILGVTTGELEVLGSNV